MGFLFGESCLGVVFVCVWSGCGLCVCRHPDIRGGGGGVLHVALGDVGAFWGYLCSLCLCGRLCGGEVVVCCVIVGCLFSVSPWVW